MASTSWQLSSVQKKHLPKVLPISRKLELLKKLEAEKDGEGMRRHGNGQKRDERGGRGLKREGKG